MPHPLLTEPRYTHPVTKGYLVKVGEFWATVDAEGDNTFRVRIDERTLAADRRSFDEALAYYRRAHAAGSELDQVFAAKPGVVVTGLHSSSDEQVLELDLERVPLSNDG
jgi:hypothetical protein